MPVLIAAGACAIGVIGLTHGGAAQEAAKPAAMTPAKAKGLMHHRHESMETIGDTFKKVRRELGGSSPNMTTVAGAAATIDRLAKESTGWFPAGTGPDVGKTMARAEIWQKPHDFSTKHAAFLKAASAFNAAAKSGNAGAAKTAFGDLGKTCKACHDLYRKEH
jgi:cytochrome c556